METEITCVLAEGVQQNKAPQPPGIADVTLPGSVSVTA